MKQLTCEMCGSTELIKQEGFFVCQTCGTKYSVEEAKKMMIEGTVDVQGTVKVDNSAFVEKCLANARRAKEKEDWSETEKYYNMVEQNDPTNIEAIFYSTYGKAMISLTDPDRFKREQIFNVLEKSISTIDDNYDISKSIELQEIITQMSADLIKMTSYSYAHHVTCDNNSRTTTKSANFKFLDSGDAFYTEKMFAKVEMKFIESIENISKLDEKAYLYRILIQHYSRCIKNEAFKLFMAKDTIGIYQHSMINAIDKMTVLDPSYNPPQLPKPKSSGCYVATAVYGSYDCPQVWTLRRYRDDTLGSTWYGRLFIRTYYAISPTLVKWFGDTNWFKKMWKGKLDRMVAKLQEKGVEDTPYEDKNWQ